MDFGQFLGNETLKARLAPAAAQQKLSHCYLLTGPRGSGKHTLARLLMAAMECTSAQVPCHRCAQCRKVAQDIHPDIRWVDDPDKKNVPVELIRETCGDAYIRPNEGKRKIYVIPRAQDLGLPGQNALLKVMEEPPSYVTFLLLCENPDKLLPTIRSRCVELALAPLSRIQMLPALRAQYPDRPEEDLLAAFSRSGGFLGQALELLAGQAAISEQTQRFAQVYAQRDSLGLLELMVKLEKLPRAEFRSCMLEWLDLLEQAMLVRSGVDSPMQLCRQIARNRTMTQLMQAAQLIQTTIQDCDANVGVGHLCGVLISSL